MKFLEFKKALKNKTIFNNSDIRKIALTFHRKRLVDWQKAGYIIKIRNGYYCFKEQAEGEHFFWHMANQIYKPSYLSLTTALSYYNLTPEAVFTQSSISTLKTASFKTAYGNFEYKNTKPALFFGYRLIKLNGLTIKMAEPEKMILDYCYLIKPESIEHFKSLRIDCSAARKLIDFDKLDAYLSIYSSKIMNLRVKLFKTYLNA